MSKTQEKRCKEIGVSRRTLNTWKAKGANVDDDLKLANFLANQRINRTEVKNWMRSVFNRVEKEIVEGTRPMPKPKPSTTVAPKKEAENTEANSIEPTKEAENRSLEQIREYYAKCLSVATTINDRDSIKYWNDLLIKVDESIRKSQAHAAKGELLSRGEVERILRAVAWSGNACIDKFSKQIAQRLSDKKPAEVHRILKPTLVALTLFEAMKRVAKCPGEVNLPEWAVECFATEEKQYVKTK
jgi:hypothetical protein